MIYGMEITHVEIEFIMDSFHVDPKDRNYYYTRLI